MKLLAISTKTSDMISCYIEDGNLYKYVLLYPDGTSQVRQKYPKNDYRDYDHFAGMMGKWDPHTAFLDKPIKVKKLNFDTISQIELED